MLLTDRKQDLNVLGFVDISKNNGSYLLVALPLNAELQK